MSPKISAALAAAGRRYERRRFLRKERQDARSKVRLMFAVVLVAVLPSTFLRAAGLPGWIVWPYFVVAAILVALLWLLTRYYGDYLSVHPDHFWPKLPKTKRPDTQVVEVTPDLESALWAEWMDRARRSGRAGEILVALLQAARPLVGRPTPRRPEHRDMRS